MAAHRTDSHAISIEKQDPTTIKTEVVHDEYLHLYPLLANKTPEEHKTIERSLKRKLDWVFLPVVTVMLLQGYLDRINVAGFLPLGEWTPLALAVLLLV